MILSRFCRKLAFLFLLASGRPSSATDDLIDYCNKGFAGLRVRVPIAALKFVQDKLVPQVEAFEKRIGPGGSYVRSMDDRALAALVEEYRQILREAENHRTAEEFRHLGDAEIKTLAEQEMQGIETRLEAAIHPFRNRLINYLDPPPKKLILEIDSAGGGPDAEQWVSQLTALYEKVGKAKGWKLEVLQVDQGGTNPRRISLAVEGADAYQMLRHEIGAHRIQSMSKAKSKTFTDKIVVSLHPQVAESEFKIPDSDLEISTTTSQGPGGQSVNKTQSAVRIKHKPTGITVLMQEERSQQVNKQKAMILLRQKVKQQEDEAKAAANRDARRGQIGTGRREESPRIRTYDLVTNKVTDHRTRQDQNGKISTLDQVDLDTFQEGLQDAYLDNLIRP